MAKKLTLEEFDKQVLEALEGPMPSAVSGNGQRRLQPRTPPALQALLSGVRGKNMGRGGIS